MKMTTLTCIAFAAAGSLFAWSSARACMHISEAYEGSFQEQSQQTIVYHDGERETLIVKVDAPAVPGASLAAVIPVPVASDRLAMDILRLSSSADPDENATMCDRLFAQMKNVVDDRSRPAPMVLGMDEEAPPVYPETLHGPYGITRFDATPAGFAALDQWMRANRMDAQPGVLSTAHPIKQLDATMPAFRYYLESSRNIKWTFCAIRMVDTSRPAVPLAINFPSRDFYLPIKLTAAGSAASLERQGKYTVYALTRAGLKLSMLHAEMERHLLDRAEGALTREGDLWLQKPIALTPELLSRNDAVQTLIRTLKPQADLQLMRFSGQFVGREAVKFADDVFAPLD